MALNTLCTFLVHVLGQVHVLTGFRAAVHRLLTVQLVRKDAKVSSYVNLDKVADTEKIAEAIRVVRRLCQEVPPVRTLLMRVGNTIPAHPLIFRYYFIGTKAKGDISDENMELLNKPSREMLKVWRAGLLGVVTADNQPICPSLDGTIQPLECACLHSTRTVPHQWRLVHALQHAHVNSCACLLIHLLCIVRIVVHSGCAYE